MVKEQALWEAITTEEPGVMYEADICTIASLGSRYTLTGVVYSVEQLSDERLSEVLIG